MDTKITLAYIDETTKAASKIFDYINELGRRVYKVRTGKNLEWSYDLVGYRKEEYSHQFYAYNRETPKFEEGTEVFILDFYYSRYEESIYVVFPTKYVEDETYMHTLESKMREEKLKEEKEELEEYAKHREQQELVLYESLKAKYDGKDIK